MTRPASVQDALPVAVSGDYDAAMPGLLVTVAGETYVTVQLDIWEGMAGNDA